MASSSRLNPGEKGKIVAKINTKGRVGPISKKVQVFSSDPKRRLITLFISARIKAEK